jgi:hypothetical protein
MNSGEWPWLKIAFERELGKRTAAEYTRFPGPAAPFSSSPLPSGIGGGEGGGALVSLPGTLKRNIYHHFAAPVKNGHTLEPL